MGGDDGGAFYDGRYGREDGDDDDVFSLVRVALPLRFSLSLFFTP